MFDSSSVTSLEMIASALEVTCDEVLSYMQTQHWKIALQHGATKNYNDIAINMEDWLEMFTHNDLREDLVLLKKTMRYCSEHQADNDLMLDLNTRLNWIRAKINDLRHTKKTSWDWLGVFSHPEEEISVLENILQEFA